MCVGKPPPRGGSCGRGTIPPHQRWGSIPGGQRRIAAKRRPLLFLVQSAMRPAALPSVILHPFCPQLVHEIGTQCSSRMSRPDNFASVEVCRTGFLARPCGRSDSSTSKTHKQPQPYKSTRNYKYQTHYLHDCPPRIPPIFPTCFGRNQQHRTQHYSANIPRYVAKLLFLIDFKSFPFPKGQMLIKSI